MEGEMTTSKTMMECEMMMMMECMNMAAVL